MSQIYRSTNYRKIIKFRFRRRKICHAAELNEPTRLCGHYRDNPISIRSSMCLVVTYGVRVRYAIIDSLSVSLIRYRQVLRSPSFLTLAQKHLALSSKTFERSILRQVYRPATQPSSTDRPETESRTRTIDLSVDNNFFLWYYSVINLTIILTFYELINHHRI